MIYKSKNLETTIAFFATYLICGNVGFVSLPGFFHFFSLSSSPSLEASSSSFSSFFWLSSYYTARRYSS